MKDAYVYLLGRGIVIRQKQSDLKESGADGSLRTLMAGKPNVAVPKSNWLPAPDGKAFSPTLRTYVPKELVKRGEWFPPAIKRIK